MTSLPSIDLGLMAEHLTAHEGIINKLELYQTIVTNTPLKDIIELHANIMHEHVRVMMALINPYQNEYVELAPINEYQMNNHMQIAREQGVGFRDKWIALEGHTTAKTMSNENYFSALMMKNQNVRTIHVQMALQQLEVQNKYEEFIEKMGWVFTPHASAQEQITTFQHYQHILGQ